MFTVVISEQEHIEAIREFEVFLKPFFDQSQVAFCPWDREGDTLSEMVPTLEATVAGRSEWRTVILCGTQGSTRRNPFDVVAYETPQREPGESDEAYFPRLRAAKFAACREAAGQPLVKLTTYLCDFPMIAEEDEVDGEADGEFAEHMAEAAYKQELRRAIVRGEAVNISKPCEICCVALRNYHEPRDEIDSSWNTYVDHQYSRFYDWNLYFDKLRYLVFDILPEEHHNYISDYIRFLCAVLLLAEHGVLSDSVRPNRVYRLDCENDESVLRRLLFSYDEKLRATSEKLEGEIAAYEREEKSEISDQEAEVAFLSGVTVPVTLSQEFDKSGLYASRKGYGLAYDCPRYEDDVWDTSYRESEKTLYRFIKQPRRSVKKAAENLRTLNTGDLDRAKLLNGFQVEDLEEYVNDAELGMVDTDTCDIYDLSRYEKEMDEENKRVQEKINSRMKRKTTVILGAIAVAVCVLCFLPLIIVNRHDAEQVALALTLMVGSAALMAVVGLVCILCFRHSLMSAISRFNGVMKGISDEIENSMAQFSRYLSHACNMMRGVSVLNYRREHEHMDTARIRVRKKHIEDIRRHREELREVYGAFLTGPAEPDQALTEAYAYDFDRAVDFDYPVPFAENGTRQIGYMQAGYTISAPVDFIKQITVDLEELYE